MMDSSVGKGHSREEACTACDVVMVTTLFGHVHIDWPATASRAIIVVFDIQLDGLHTDRNCAWLQ